MGRAVGFPAPGYHLGANKKPAPDLSPALGSCRALAKKALATFDIDDVDRLAVSAPDLEACRPRIRPDHLARPHLAGWTYHISVLHDQFTTIPLRLQCFSAHSTASLH